MGAKKNKTGAANSHYPVPDGQPNTFLGLPCHCLAKCSTLCGRTALPFTLIVMLCGTAVFPAVIYFSALPQQSPAPQILVSPSPLSFHCLLNVFLPLPALANPVLELTSAVLSAYIRHRDITLDKVHSLQLYMVQSCNIHPGSEQRRLKIRDFWPAVSRDLLCLQVLIVLCLQ